MVGSGRSGDRLGGRGEGGEVGRDSVGREVWAGDGRGIGRAGRQLSDQTSKEVELAVGVGSRGETSPTSVLEDGEEEVQVVKKSKKRAPHHGKR